MASLNRVMLIGNITRDPSSKQLPGGTSVCEFGLAMNRRFKTSAGEEREEVLFVDCSAWGKQGETIQQYCTKGKPLFIEGRLKLDTWDDKQGGGKRSKITVVVENFQFLGAPGGGGDDRQQHPPDTAISARNVGRESDRRSSASGNRLSTTNRRSRKPTYLFDARVSLGRASARARCGRYCGPRHL
jgi:single-strand DNA-binding protein